MGIKACIICGNKELEWADTIIPGAAMTWGSSTLTGQMKCNRCGHFGNPIEFSNEKAWSKYEKTYRTRKAKSVQNVARFKLPIYAVGSLVGGFILSRILETLVGAGIFSSGIFWIGLLGFFYFVARWLGVFK